MLSFDEFHAVQKRMRAQKKEEDSRQRQLASQKDSRPKQGTVDGTDGKDPSETDDDNEEAGAVFTIGSFLEMQETQTAVLIVAALDILVAIVQVILQPRGVTQIDTTAQWLLHNALQSFSSFTFFFYGLELLATFVAFRWRTLTHFGYVFDTVLLAGSIAAQAKGIGPECRLLGVYRLWRIARLVTYLVDQEKAAHAETQISLQEKEKELLASKTTVLRLEAEIRSEQEARRAVESTLRQYKDEVDLLNEALQEAAKDVVIAGLEAEMEGTDDDEASALEQEEDKPATATGQQDQDAFDESTEVKATTPRKKVTPRRHAPTVIIHEDGSFEKH